MTHDQAVAIIKGPREPGAAGYLRYSAACAKVYVDHMAHAAPSTFTTDAVPVSAMATVDKLDWILEKVTRSKTMRTATRDQTPPRFAGSGSDIPLADPRSPTTFGAQHTRGGVGGKKLTKLRGDLGDFYIGLDEDGDPALFQHVASDNLLDPGAISIKSKTLTGDQRREITRDAARSTMLLAGINEANTKFWASR